MAHMSETDKRQAGIGTGGRRGPAPRRSKPKPDRKPPGPVRVASIYNWNKKPHTGLDWESLRRGFENDLRNYIMGRMQSHRVPAPDDPSMSGEDDLHRQAEAIVAAHDDDRTRQQAIAIDQQLTQRQAQIDAYNRQQSQYQYSYRGGGGHGGSSVNYGALIQGIGSLFGGHGGGGGGHHQ
jgi:hypothetical protein